MIFLQSMLFIVFYVKLDFGRVLTHICEDEYFLNLDSAAAAGLAGSVTDSMVAELNSCTLVHSQRTCTWLSVTGIRKCRVHRPAANWSEKSTDPAISHFSTVDPIHRIFWLGLHFLLADRITDCLLHLDTVTKVLPLFAAVGHTNCAKAAHIYISRAWQWCPKLLIFGNIFFIFHHKTKMRKK